MNIPKYSKFEVERRWLVPPAYVELLKNKTFVTIEDRYFKCGRLRLRTMVNTLTGEKIFKLCKKYGSITSLSEPITNIYLDENEFNALCTLPAFHVRKKRYKEILGGIHYNIDVFEDNLARLVLFEVEAEDEETIKNIATPTFAIKEVTDDIAFSGGKLCQYSNYEIAALLS